MDVMTTGFVGWFLIALTAGTEPRILVERLGSPRYSEREAASVELEKLGASALPVLRSARLDSDPEVKSRAEMVMDSIERSMLTRPSQITLPVGRPNLAEILDAISQAEGVPIDLDDNRAARVRSLDIPDRTPQRFWPLMDRLSLIPRYEFDADFGRRRFWRVPSLKFVTKNGPNPDISDSGPFRILARPLSLGYEPQPLDGNFRAPGIGRLPRVDRQLDLVLPLEVLSEPRLTLRASGPVRVIEAIDDLDQDLATTARGGEDPSGDLALRDRAISILPLQIRMNAPSRSGKVLKRVKGLIPVEVEARKLEPTAIPLSVSSPEEHRPVVCGGSLILVHSVTPRENLPGYQLDLTIRRDGPRVANMNPRFANRRMIEMATDLDQVWESTEIVDAQGRSFRYGAAQPVQIDADGGIRLVLPILPNDGGGLPSELRYHGEIRAQVEIPFEFHDLRLP